jgi:hypothetical protein
MLLENIFIGQNPSFLKSIIKSSAWKRFMASKTLDGVIEAVRYKPDGHVDWVRAYLRRGPTFSDRIIINRATLIENLNSGKRYFTGKPIPLKASTFEVDKPLQLVQKDGQAVLIAGDIQTVKDCLASVPRI